MYFLKKTKIIQIITVSVVGAVTHNIAQIVVAIFVLEVSQLIYYFPVLLLTGTISGIIVGIIAGIISKRIDLSKKEDV